MAKDYLYCTAKLESSGSILDTRVEYSVADAMSGKGWGIVYDNYGNFLEGDLLYDNEHGELRAYDLQDFDTTDGKGDAETLRGDVLHIVNKQNLDRHAPADGHTIQIPDGVSPYHKRIQELEADQHPYYVITPGKPPRLVDPKHEATHEVDKGHGLPANLGKPQDSSVHRK